MKSYSLLLKIVTSLNYLFFLTNFLVAQSSDLKSDLQVKIDSIILYQIGYTVDSTTNKLPKHKWDSINVRGMYPSFNSLPENPMPLIIFDSKVIELNELDKYTLSDISEIHVYEMNNKSIMAIYGNRVKNSLIVIELIR